MLLAAGAVSSERIVMRARFGPRLLLRSVLKAAPFVWLLGAMLWLLPVVLPVLPVEAYLRYQAHLPFPVPRSEHGHRGAALPQHYADEFGWPEMVAAVARVYHSLAPA